MENSVSVPIGSKQGARKEGLKVLAVVPCLNEAAYIENTIRSIMLNTESLDLIVAAVDGGSTDSTKDIVRHLANGDPRIILMDNPRRIQSAAINLAVKVYSNEFDVLVRVDAHSDYPVRYIVNLVDAYLKSGAESVVVPMLTVGKRCFQSAVACAQNSRLGNGGAPHRSESKPRFVEHGHHALMNIDAFISVGGYDESFSQNEDAELDYRLIAAGYRIWLDTTQRIVYYPRDRPLPLFRQYYLYGKGRARNIIKHGTRPKFRQTLPLAVGPVTALAILGFRFPIFAVPFLLWAFICCVYGACLAVRIRSLCALLSGPAAMIMHLGWSLGSLCCFVSSIFRKFR